ncbi:PREDICTED: probable peptide chain release factor C12orf65 homolog, mitochondrial [Polistes dominula]|uniref:Probable peptide chain release factor C12orf65 homolog, mitochondrial n=1 Tax=Polistes dominula TaxID=743375 RepID=A0ABM1HX91_POLDO|nr:PREDICTED: probable peptide chain release factor C12orf65 homolog, mitochondrial [Polistes dominula]
MNRHVYVMFSYVQSITTKRSLFYAMFQFFDRKIHHFHTPIYSHNNNNKKMNIHHTSFYDQIRLKSFKRFLDYSKVPTLNENELEENFVRGSGPGGQATNKTNNAVTLKHKPTGIVVKCHETRSVWINQKRAREILITKLDNLLNGDESIENQEKKLQKQSSIKKKQKQKKLAELKKSFKEREGLV